uniref:Uncharacterized protein n=1 Tax=Arundo donax TaxID=35708 RepID=A0A0A8YN23_ARUDO
MFPCLALCEDHLVVMPVFGDEVYGWSGHQRWGRSSL